MFTVSDRFVVVNANNVWSSYRSCVFQPSMELLSAVGELLNSLYTLSALLLAMRSSTPNKYDIEFVNGFLLSSERSKTG